jgi:hypothetical protein
MKIIVTMKSPDALDAALMDLPLEHQDKARKAAEQWFDYGEYLSVEIDTVEGTCTVLPAS